MFDFLFSKSDMTLMETIIIVIATLCVIKVVPILYERLPNKNSLNLLKRIYEFIDDVFIINAKVLFDMFRGFDYYEIGEYPDWQRLQMGSVLRIEDNEFPNKPKIQTSDNPRGNLATVLEIGYINHYNKWVRMRVHRYKNQPNTHPVRC